MNRILNNKRGSLKLPEEVINVVISLIAIGILAILLYSIYQNNKDSENLEFAKESLSLLVSEISSGKEEVKIYNPEDWVLGTWPHKLVVGYSSEGSSNFGSEILFPESCSNLGWKSCICICNENNVESCDNDGICLNNPQNFIVVGDIALKGNVLPEGVIKITNPPITLNIDQTNKKISK